MTVLTAATPTMEAIYGLLQDATLQTAIGGRLFDDIPEDTPLPNVLVEIFDETDIRGLGTGGLPELDVRIHVFSALGSLVEAQAINQQIVALLKDAAILLTGYAQAGLIVYRHTVTLRAQELNSVKVHEVVSLFTVWAEQS